MGVSSLHVHTFLACQNVSWDGPAGPRTTRTLEGVAYSYQTTVPNGFPFEAEFWFFVRFGHDARKTITRQIFVTMTWHDDPELRPEVWSRPFHVVTLEPRKAVRDVAARLAAVFEGRGTYEFRLWYQVKRKWDHRVQKRTIARTSINIEG